MPLDLATLARKTATVDVEYADETFAVTYKPHVFTVQTNAELQAQLRAVQDDEERAVEMVIGVLVRVLDGWDVTEEGMPLPVTDETLRRFPLQLLTRIVERVGEDVADPNRVAQTADATPSSSGSSAAVVSVLRPTGTAP